MQTVLMIAAITLAVLLAVAVLHNVGTNKLLAECRAANSALHDLLDTRVTTAQKFVNACRLIAIHRDGRTNVFTFMRADKTFTIETMGMLSDTPDDWRKLAGLDDYPLDASKLS